MSERKNWDSYYLDIATATAQRATCPRLSVGAVLVKNRRILATGYNGSPAGRPHCTDVGCAIWEGHCIRSVHAETNALLDAGREARGATLYCTHLPCVECCKLLMQSYVYTVIAPEEDSYKDERTALFGFSSRTELLRKSGVQVKLLNGGGL